MEKELLHVVMDHLEAQNGALQTTLDEIDILMCTQKGEA